MTQTNPPTQATTRRPHSTIAAQSPPVDSPLSLDLDFLVSKEI